ncbi:MAG: FAD-dependent oxidoreductase, partial [Candidatus Neomarinimicrobiota bacterium]
GRFPEALEVVRRNNPLPAICGRVCTHPCEAACNRIEIDDPVAICALKRFLTDYELAHPPAPPQPVEHIHDERVAIVGSGPAGLTAAHDLARQGYGVTIFEALPKAGGMLVAGVPSFRLPRDILELEIDMIQALGVDIQTGAAITGERATDGLFDEGYQAIFYAIGAHQPRTLGCKGEDAAGVVDCLTFLREANLGKPTPPGRRTVVIGGGHSALDSAQMALRLDAEEVKIIYRRSRKEMPAHQASVRGAEEEGVLIDFLVAPLGLLVKNGRVTGVECIRTRLGEPDESGRRRPEPVKGSEFIVEADTVITAVGELSDLSFLPEKHGLEISTRWSTFVADETVLATNRPGIFAGGDVVTGPKSVIDAIAAGHTAARSMHRYLRGRPLTKEQLVNPPAEVEIKVDIKHRPSLPRLDVPFQPKAERIQDFREIELGFSTEEALAEAARCLRCGPCSECEVCVPECDKQIVLLSTANGDGALVLRVLPAMDAAKLPLESSDIRLSGESGTEAGGRIHPLISIVDQGRCRGCGDCVEVCEYDAVELIPREGELLLAQVDEARCRGCGTCVAYCPPGAMSQSFFGDDWLDRRLGELSPANTNLVVITCSWGGARLHDFAGHQQRKGLDITYLQTMCAGRVEPAMVLKAFEMGADGVLINSCGVDDCHYDFGAAQFTGTYGRIQQLTRLVGLDPARLRYEQIPAGETARFDSILRSFANRIKKLGPAEQSVRQAVEES